MSSNRSKKRNATKKAKKKLRKFERSYMVTEKNSLKNILKVANKDELTNIIMDAVQRTNQIVIHTYQFIKAYLLYLYDYKLNHPKKNIVVPTINQQLILNIMNIVSIKNENSGAKPLNNTLTQSLQDFFEKKYSTTLADALPSRDSLRYILQYEAVDIVKNISTNIKEHFMSHLHNYIRIHYSFDKQIDKIKNDDKITDAHKKISIAEIHDTWHRIVQDVTNVADGTIYSEPEYYDDIIKFKKKFLPEKESFAKKSVYYDVKAHPFDYIFNMITINRAMNVINDKIIRDCGEDEKPKLYKLFNIVPLRTEIIPKYITIDTSAFITLFPVSKKGEMYKNLAFYKNRIWSRFVHTNKRVFKKKGFKFSSMIKTDGVGVSILFAQTDKRGKIIDPPTRMEEKLFEETTGIKYIEDVNLTSMKHMQFVAGDPGKTDLLSFIKEDPKTGEFVTHQFTLSQRNKDTKHDKYNNIRNAINDYRIGRRTVKEIEESLSLCNSKTCDQVEFLVYLENKNRVNSKLFNHYGQNVFRKLRFNSHINRRRSEDNMVNGFRKKMGSPEKVIVVLGDYSASTLKGTQAAPTVHWRKVFKRHRYKVFLIREHNTSKMCSCCSRKGKENQVENFVERKHSKNKEKRKKKREYEKKSGKKSLVWKLVRCKVCKSIHNRDSNAGKNMLTIIKSLRRGTGRPKMFECNKRFGVNAIKKSTRKSSTKKQAKK